MGKILAMREFMFSESEEDFEGYLLKFFPELHAITFSKHQGTKFTNIWLLVQTTKYPFWKEYTGFQDTDYITSCLKAWLFLNKDIYKYWLL